MTNEAGISLNEKDSDVSFVKSEFNLRYAFAKNHYASISKLNRIQIQFVS